MTTINTESGLPVGAETPLRKIQLVLVEGDAPPRVLIENVQHLPNIWSLNHNSGSIDGLDHRILRGASFLAFHAACNKLPVDPGFHEGVAAAASFRSIEDARKNKAGENTGVGFRDGGTQLAPMVRPKAK